MSTEQKELDLVEKVDFRILGISNNEEKLQALLKVYLAPLLLKLASEHASVRNKVMAICQRLPTFIQPPGIVLPVAALLDQYKATQSPLVKYFDLIFIQHSVVRLEAHERRELIPRAIKGIGSDTGTSLANLFNVFLRLLLDLNLPPRGSKQDEALREDMGLSDPKDAQFVAEWLGKLLLLRAHVPGAATSPGLTEADVSFLTLSNKKETWAPSSKGLRLPETRIKAVSFLASGAFTDEERFMPAIYAAASADFRLSGLGEDILKRSSVSLEDEELVKKLFEAHTVLSPPNRTRILGLLSKSEISTRYPDKILAVFKQNVVSQTESAGGEAMEVDGGAPSNTKVTSGLELTKLHRATFEYIKWVARIGPSKTDFSKIGPPLVALLRDFIESQGWPRPDKEHLSIDETALRSGAYETIGAMAKSTGSMSMSDRLELTEWLFRSLSEDPSAAVINIEGALSSFSLMLKTPDNSSALRLRSLLLGYMTADENRVDQQGKAVVVRSARYSATKWANNCLPFSDVVARWIDILAVAGRRDERNDVVEEGRKGLDPWTYYANDDRGPADLPSWQDMVQTFFKEDVLRSVSSSWLSGLTPLLFSGADNAMDIDSKSPVFKNFKGDAILAFPEALQYCLQILFLTALNKSFKFEPGWERQLDSLVDSDLATRQTLRKYLAKSDPASHTATYSLLAAAFEGMVMEDNRINIEWSLNCAKSFVRLASFVPKMLLPPLVSRSRELLGLVTSNNQHMRHLAAAALGILAAHPENTTEFENTRDAMVGITKGLELAVGSTLNAVEGSFLGLGHLTSRRIYYGANQPTDGVSKLDEALSAVFPTLEGVSSKGLSTQEALFETYSQIWSVGLQTINVAVDREKFEKGFVDPLVAQAKKGNGKAITALGRLAMSVPVKYEAGQESIGLLQLILDKLYALYEIKQAEVHFAVGEAITTAIACWDAEVVQLVLDVEAGSKANYWVPRRPAAIKMMLERLLTDCKTTKPSLLKASGIWLFCLIRHCSHLDEIQSRLRECQVAFMRLLSARDELVQETASRGLSLVYEKGDAALKDQLVKDLVSSFTGTAPKLEVEGDTELFDAGALPTGEGKSITSYKDILNLASEVGDQTLVYKFMSLATNAATWTTRSAFGRFGLSSILSESEVDPKIYPKLYRYRFDPNTNVQKSMNDIWKALVKNPGAVLEEHFDAIMEDLLKSILGKEWRVREASCAAISDLVSGRPFEKYERYYKPIWAAALRVLDDVKGSVRKAALHLCISLSTTLVRQLEDSGSTAAATAMINEALPFLLSSKGMESGAEEVKGFATITVVKICKTGGKSLKPYIATTVPHLLGILSTIEPDVINYYYQKIGEDKKEQLDKARAAMVSQSPITEGIENLLRSVDKEVMAALAPNLEEAVNSAIGMPTKIGCASVLSTLATRHAIDFRPYSGKFLQLMEKHILDRNDEVSQGYARAAAYIIRAAPDDSQLRYVGQLQKLYLTSEDETRREKVAYAVLALSKVSPDHFGALETHILPLVYLAKHDTDDYVRKACEEVWEKHAGSELSVTRYISEIVRVVNGAMGTAQWALRHSAAFTVSDAVSNVIAATTLSGSTDLTNLETLWPEYEKALAMKTFEGKEKLLEPFPDFVAKTKALWTEGGDKQKKGFGELLKKIAVREAKRNNNNYRPHAFRCLWRFAEKREDLQLLGDIVEIVGPYLDIVNNEEVEDADKMDIDDDKSVKKDKKEEYNRSRGLDAKSLTVWAAMEAVARGYNRSGMKKDPLGELGKIVDAFEEVGSSGKAKKGEQKDWLGGDVKPFIALEPFAIIRRVHWYECAEEVLKDAAAAAGLASDEGKKVNVLSWFLVTLDLDNADVGTEDQRLARVKATMAVAKIAKAVTSKGAEDGLLNKVESAVERALDEERSLVVQGKWKEVLGVV
ncbi:Proteasome stabiliser domain containing protein [Naviculisporaceae sp. PSN 640]